MEERLTDRRAQNKSRCPSQAALFVYKGHPNFSHEGDALRYALLIYNDRDVLDRTPEEEQRRINDAIYEVLERPNVTGWLRLRNVEAATTVRYEQGRTLLTDGPFVDSKDYLGGFILVGAENLDGALVIAGELQERRAAAAIEVRPVLEENLVGA
jgi:hypothetical protein